MNSICRDIFRAIHEGKWLSIEYRNKKDNITKYWIGISDLNVYNKSLKFEGLHLSQYTIQEYDCIYIESILSSEVIEGSYCAINSRLVKDINLNPHKYKTIFDNVANLKILNYLEICNRMDATPYYSQFELIKRLDRDSFSGNMYSLNSQQFRMIVKHFQYKAENANEIQGKLSLQQLAINVLSINTSKGLYVLAYRPLRIDVEQRVLRPDKDIVICTEFIIDSNRESIRKYMDADDYELLDDFEKNAERIKDCICKFCKQNVSVDDMPYIIGIGSDVILDLHSEYKAILNMYSKGEDKVTVPIKAFFGDLLARPNRRKAYPIMLLDKKVNLDQLLAINNAMKYPITYVQGPPGTGKTNTIINTIITAFFNGKTVLFASYNNHPINGVYNKLSSMEYSVNGQIKTIPFPVLRLGNNEKVKETLATLKLLYERTKKISVFHSTLDKNKENRIERAKKLSSMLKRYDEILDLEERCETLKQLVEYQKDSIQTMSFVSDLQERQLQQAREKLMKCGNVTEEDALALLDDDEGGFKKYLYYISAQYIQKINLPQNSELKEIIYMEDEEEQLYRFNTYLKKTENVKKLQNIFPIIITTCISAHRIGTAKPMFDMVIIDEASQCNTAVSLVPIIRGESLMLVGDPQQLNPVILLDKMYNEKLRKKYCVTEEYDYCRNSIYKTFLACDSVSDEVLLQHHYRCNEKIIQFNNRKYYRSKLIIKSQSTEKKPLVFWDVQESKGDVRNTAPAEVAQITKYALDNQDKTIGVITPFVNQKNLVERELQERNIKNVSCGTIHAFQGDEKDVILFSTAITDDTRDGTYEWLKNNKELINVATSRAKDKLIILSSMKDVERLHRDGEDDLYELIQYVRKNGNSAITPK